MLDDRIFIKGNREGVNAVVDMNKFSDYDEMVETLVERLKKGKKFYKGSVLTIIMDLNHVDDRMQRKLKEILFDEVLIKDCIFKEKQEKEERVFSGVSEGRTKFIKRTVRSGQLIEYTGNIVIIGDVNPGAEVVAHGNIIVLGALKGHVHAGSNGNKKAIIAAFSLQPEVLQICDVLTISPDGEKPRYPEVAKLKDNAIIVEPYLPNKYMY
ncbi:septum site-determining protein MinC [Inconstantimicrobium mannanitabidum]|uniref:Septum site-determining protein MinC n=1 Tax=Inconstantimicrobium mannanitabidum TaxID=1604901 RepID=A0ACB5R7E4_9CLOT|nr:septum site-determining protein MinC [Clostridium sp. TW13]GKX65118.1 putative septum site-determining protein MinC [Clostridium sp. TW13]